MKNRLKILTLVLAVIFVFGLVAVALQTPDTAKDPVCGMSVKIADAKNTADYKGTTYYFCNPGCKAAFEKDPEKYLAKPDGAQHMGMGGGMGMHSAQAVQIADTAKDPVCGMSVKTADAKYTSEYKGTKYYFCSEGCKTEFSKNPEKYLAKTDAAAAHMGGMMAGCAMGNCPFMMKDVDKKFENTKDGAVITLLSKNPDSVKKIQEHAAKMKEGQGAAAGMSGSAPDGSCSCPGCATKKK